MQRLLQEHPEEVEELDGFVYFSDFVGSYSKTKMSMPYILSGKWYENDQTVSHFLSEAYESVDLWNKLKKADYDIGIYTSNKYLDTDMLDVASNLKDVDRVIGDHWGLAQQMLEFLAFTYMPHVVKPYFEFYSGDFGNYYAAADGSELYSRSNFKFQTWSAQPFTLQEQKVFRLYHLTGSHLPCNMDADGNRVGRW